MMPVFVASTWSRYDEALKSLKAQFQPGNRSVIEAKVAELTRGIQGNPQAVRNAIARYMTELYQLGRCGVSLQDAATVSVRHRKSSVRLTAPRQN